MVLELSRLVLLVPTFVTSLSGCITIAILGILSHRLYFIRGEHHHQAPLYCGLWILLSISAIVAIFSAPGQGSESGHGLLDSLCVVSIINVVFFGALFGSIFVYRVFQHPLSDFDGPRFAAVSKLWHSGKMLTTENHLLLDSLRAKYGNIIRTGPQELTIVDPGVIHAIGGPGTSCIKPPFYELLLPYKAVNAIREKHAYAPRRRKWDEALGANYSHKESRVQHVAALLLRQIHASAPHPINMTTWFYHFSFDAMGDLGFGQSFSLIPELDGSTSKPHFAPELISQGLSMLRFFSPTPWLGRICLAWAPYLPFVSQKLTRALGWAAETCDAKLERATAGNTDNQDDVFSHFIRAAFKEGDVESLNRFALYGDAFAVTVAGSHTVALTLTFLFYELAQRPALQEALRSEIEASGVMKSTDGERRLRTELNMPALEQLPLLDACINEALRLYPPVPTGGMRQTVKPVTIAGRLIPPDTVIVAPRWSIGRMESAFQRPNDFIPERWTTKPEMVIDARAFNAFAIGRYVCPGKKMGMLEVRTVATMIIANFEFLIDPSSKRPSGCIDDIKDSFTASAGDLDLIFKPISQSHSDEKPDGLY